MVFGGTVFRATVFGLLAAPKTAPLKLHPKMVSPNDSVTLSLAKLQFRDFSMILKFNVATIFPGKN